MCLIVLVGRLNIFVILILVANIPVNVTRDPECDPKFRCLKLHRVRDDGRVAHGRYAVSLASVEPHALGRESRNEAMIEPCYTLTVFGSSFGIRRR